MANCSRVGSLREEFALLERQKSLAALRLKGAREAHERYRELFGNGFISRDVLLARETERAEAQERVQVLAREALSLEREIASTQREVDTVRARNGERRAELERSVLLARQEFAQVEASRRIVVGAPADGRVTLVQADVGQSLSGSFALAHLVPASSPLVSQLYAPSRAAGFVRPGDTVLIRYDAFPYQKFGQHAGKVLEVSTAAVPPTELQGASSPAENVAEQLFAITVQLPSQAMMPGNVPLYSGMRVEADILHETRKLYEWILEPLLIAKARLQDE